MNMALSHRPHILVTVPVTDAQKAKILSTAKDCPVDFCPASQITPEHLVQAEILFGNLAAPLLRDAKSLKWMQLNSAGADDYVKPGVLPPDTLLTTAVGAYGLSVSEHMLAMLLSMFRHFPQYEKNQLQCLWRTEGQVRSIEGSTVLTLGLGNIGGDFARKVKALGAYTIGVRRKTGDCPDYMDEMHTLDQLDALLPRADVVAVSLPLTPETRYLFNAERFALMKHDAILINIGRGAIVDSQALLDALNRGEVGGACLDVTDPEPLPPDHPLWQHERVLITPHAAGRFFLPETLNRIVGIFCDNLTRCLNQQPLRNIMPH